MNNELVMGQEVLRDIDAALASDQAAAEAAARAKAEKLNNETDKRFGRASQAMRTIAVVILIAAAGVFMLQGWSGMDSVNRILSFLGFTSLLTLGGLFCGVKLKDDKGARTALALGTMLVPVVFSQVGGLVYSVVSPIRPSGPEMFVLTSSSPLWVAITTVLCLILLTPTMLAGFSALARSRAKTLALAYGLGNAVLLVPIRDPNYVGFLALIMLAALTSLDLRQLNQDSRLRNHEGNVARLLIFVPLVILIFRNLVMWAPTAMFISSMLMLLGIGFFFALPRYFDQDEFVSVSESFGALFFSGAWIVLANDLFIGQSAIDSLRVSKEFAIPLLGLPTAAIFFLLSFLTRSIGIGFRVFSVAIAVTTAVLQMGCYEGIFSSVLCIVTAIAVAIIGTLRDETSLTGIGIFGLIVGLSYHLKYAARLYTLSPWLSLALIGLVVLVLSSLIEKHHVTILNYIKALRVKFVKGE